MVPKWCRLHLRHLIRASNRVGVAISPVLSVEYITLLPSGEAIATRIYERHQILTQFLVQLGVSPENAVADACKIEHDISDESYEKIKSVTLSNQS